MFRTLAVMTTLTVLLASCGSVQTPVTLRAQEECPSCGVDGPRADPDQVFWGWTDAGLLMWAFGEETQTPDGPEVYVHPSELSVLPGSEGAVHVGCMQRRRVRTVLREPYLKATVKVVPTPGPGTLTSAAAATAYCAAQLGSSWRIVTGDPLLESWDGAGFWASGQRLTGATW